MDPTTGLLVRIVHACGHDLCIRLDPEPSDQLDRAVTASLSIEERFAQVHALDEFRRAVCDAART